ncbi:MAG: hypothetical protein R3C39_10320 [Dehalococcoidia bacterium]
MGLPVAGSGTPLWAAAGHVVALWLPEGKRPAYVPVPLVDPNWEERPENADDYFRPHRTWSPGHYWASDETVGASRTSSALHLMESVLGAPASDDAAALLVKRFPSYGVAVDVEGALSDRVSSEAAARWAEYLEERREQRGRPAHAAYLRFLDALPPAPGVHAELAYANLYFEDSEAEANVDRAQREIERAALQPGGIGWIRALAVLGFAGVEPDPMALVDAVMSAPSPQEGLLRAAKLNPAIRTPPWIASTAGGDTVTWGVEGYSFWPVELELSAPASLQPVIELAASRAAALVVYATCAGEEPDWTTDSWWEEAWLISALEVCLRSAEQAGHLPAIGPLAGVLASVEQFLLEHEEESEMTRGTTIDELVALNVESAVASVLATPPGAGVDVPLLPYPDVVRAFLARLPGDAFRSLSAEATQPLKAALDEMRSTVDAMRKDLALLPVVRHGDAKELGRERIVRMTGGSPSVEAFLADYPRIAVAFGELDPADADPARADFAALPRITTLEAAFRSLFPPGAFRVQSSKGSGARDIPLAEIGESLSLGPQSWRVALPRTVLEPIERMWPKEEEARRLGMLLRTLADLRKGPIHEDRFHDVGREFLLPELLPSSTATSAPRFDIYEMVRLLAEGWRRRA